MQILFQASASVKFVPVQLIKANHMSELRVRVGGAYKITGQGVLIQESC